MQQNLKYASLIVLGVIATIGAGCKLMPSTSNSNVTTTGTIATTNTTSNEPVVDVNDTDDTTQTDTEVVTSDVYGEDMEQAVRYPESIRSYYSKNELETDITYQTTATQDEVRTFYKDLLVKSSWTVSEEATDYVEFSKGDDANPEYLTVYLTPYNNTLEYELVYEPPYTDEQLQQLEADTTDDTTTEAE